MVPTNQQTRLTRVESGRKVASPLQQMRGIIRLYVTVEGCAALVAYAALCFWIGLLLDYGIFKITGLDWIHLLGRPVRGGVLACLLIGLVILVTVKVVGRLMCEFRAPALALLLERRFPKLFGDRLITAVELADPKKASRYGYSQVMLDQTIEEAAGLVDQAPVHDVFNWRRLRRSVVTAFALSMGVYLLVACSYCGLARAFAEKPDGLVDFVQRFNQVSGIWFERNVLLRHVPWPRRALLEVVDFPGQEKRVGRSPGMTLNVQAYRWVIVDEDRDNRDGWRPLRWADLHRFVNEVPGLEGDLRPPKWPADRIDEMPVDEIESYLTRRADLPGAMTQPIRDVLAQLDELAGAIRNQRTLRKLQIPDDVRLTLRGATLDTEQTLEARNDHRYTCTLPELKEDIRLWVRGADYVTPTKSIKIEAPAELRSLVRDEDHPAYLYYPLPPGAPAEALKGMRQQVRGLPVSVIGEDTCHLEVPLGSHLVLTGQADKDLVNVGINPIAGIATSHQVERLDQRGQFRIEFAQVTRKIDFILEMKDQYDVVGYRHVVITPVEDLPPEVAVQVEVVRKTSQGFMITPRAMVYLGGKVQDDHGIAHAEYGYAISRLEVQRVDRLQALFTARLIGWQGMGVFRALAALAHEHRFRQAAGEVVEQPPASAELRTFHGVLRERERLATPLAQLGARLQQPPPDRHQRDRTFLKEFVLDPETEFFDVEKLGLKNENAPLIRYRLRLWVQARDTNIETGPGTSRGKEDFLLYIVPEEDLLNEVAREEEGFNIELTDAVARLKVAQARLKQVVSDLPGLKEGELKQVSRWTTDVGEVAESIVATENTARHVLTEYRRILQELKANRVKAGMIRRVRDHIVEPLDLTMREDFPHSEQSSRALLKSMKAGTRDMAAGQKAVDDLDGLVKRLDKVLGDMEGLIDLNKLIKEFTQMRDALLAGEKVLDEKIKQKEQEYIDELTKPRQNKPGTK
jgi:hypothetical protein